MSQPARTTIPHRQPRRISRALAIMSLAGIAAAVQAEPTSASASVAGAKQSGSYTSGQDVLNGKPMQIRIGKVKTEYVIAAPKAKQSKATRVVNPAIPAYNIVHDVYAQIVVKTQSEAVLNRVLNSTGSALGLAVGTDLTYRPAVGDSKRTFVIDTPDVESAIRLVNRLERVADVEWAEVGTRAPVQNLSMGGGTITTDPTAPYQWHIFNNPAIVANQAPFDGNHFIDLVYARGYTGLGVTVGVLEADINSFFNYDAIGNVQIHPDLALKTDFDLSRPTSEFNVNYSHGVSVAGLIGAEGNNGIHGAGVAYNATLASLRNGSNIDSAESFGWELNSIDIVNNSWGPINETFPPDNTGKFIKVLPDDLEITVPQVTHSNLSTFQETSIDRGVRLGRTRNGRIYVFASGNSSHFQGFQRLALGNAISLPGIGTDPSVDPYGYLDIWSLNPDEDGDGNPDNNADGIPDAFILDGTGDNGAMPPVSALGWRWSGHLGGRTEYNPYTSPTRTLAIAAVGKDRVRSGFSTTGTAVFASAYSQITTLNQEFGMANWGSTSFDGTATVTLEQQDSTDRDALNFVNCNAVFPGIGFVDNALETCIFNGTSAAAPIASGIIALMLEANPSLTLRDVQAIIQQTAIVPEETGSDPANADFYDPTESYWPSVILALGETDPDDNPNSPVPTFWTTNSADVRHSDEYGFGIIDANAAIQMAETFEGVGQLILLDTGVKNAGDDGDDGGNPFFDDGAIEDATFELVRVVSENLETNRLTPGTRYILPIACVRDNIEIEGVEIDLTISGDGAGDLLIALQSPRGTISPLALPRGDSNGLSGTAYADHTFGTYKHWGELAGGTWNLIIQDFRPDEDSPEGDPPDDMPDPMDPGTLGVEQVTYLGAFGMPGNSDHSEKSLESYRFRIYGHEVDAPVFDGCPPALTGCPGDLDGNGVIDITDLQIYVNWWLISDARADINVDGTINFDDVLAYLAIWTPGFCADGGLGGARPRPGGTSIGDNDPQTRPI